MNQRENISEKQKFYNEVRSKCNISHDPNDFFFITRTTINGLIRYNKSGNLNNSFHLTRKGMNPVMLGKIVNEWAELLNRKNVIFTEKSYENLTEFSDSDVCYLDPPYFGTNGMYFGKIEYDPFFGWLSKLSCKWVLSYDGKNTYKDYTIDIPKIYKRHIYNDAGNSAFGSMVAGKSDRYVKESLYLSY